MRSVGAHLYEILLSLWVGGIFLFTFVVTPVIFSSYTRDVAGDIVGKLFPSYFLFSLAVPAFSLAVFSLSFPDRHVRLYVPSLVLLIAAVVISLYVSVKLHPEIKKVKQEIASFEATERDNLLRKKFKSLHAQSAVLNLILLADGVALLVMSAGMKK
jgi:Ca2+/Na+ antiporter